MPRWRQQVEGLLYDGEVIRETIAVDTARVVVTSHRVLAFTPARQGENFQQADGPNVVGVEAGNAGGWSWLRRALGAAAIGGFSLLVGVLVDFDAMLGGADVETEQTEGAGDGGLLDGFQVVFDLLMRLDELVQLFGLFWLLVAAVLALVYWFWERDPVLLVRVAGESPDIHLPRPADSETTLTRLERAILSDVSERSRSETGTGDDGRKSDEGFGRDDLLGEDVDTREWSDVPDDVDETSEKTAEADDDSDGGVWPGE